MPDKRDQLQVVLLFSRAVRENPEAGDIKANKNLKIHTCERRRILKYLYFREKKQTEAYFDMFIIEKISLHTHSLSLRL